MTKSKHILGCVVIRKLKSDSGETLIEAMLAMVVAAFAMLMLALAIQVSAGIIASNQTKADEYYKNNVKLINLNDATSGVMDVTVTEGITYDAGENTTKVKVSCVDVELPRGKTGIAYKEAESTAESTTSEELGS